MGNIGEAISAALMGNLLSLQAAGAVFTTVLIVYGANRIQYVTFKKGDANLKTLLPPIQDTLYAKEAEQWLKRRLEATKGFSKESLFLPFLIMAFIVGACAFISYYGAYYYPDPTQKFPSFILGGSCLLRPDDAERLYKYQLGTLLTGSMAFLGAFLWLIRQFIMRLNINDVSPATYYFMSARVLTACIVAGIVRHFLAAHADPSTCESQDWIGILPALGFVIGWRPYLWIDWILARVRDQVFSIKYPQVKAKDEDKPEKSELSMIQGLIPDRIERLQELDVTDCEKLSRDNLIVLWIRTTYNLCHLLDWAAQAYLISYLPNAIVSQLSKIGVRDILTYFEFLSRKDLLEAISTTTGLSFSILEGHRVSLPNCPTFIRLRELSDKLADTDNQAIVKEQAT